MRFLIFLFFCANVFAQSYVELGFSGSGGNSNSINFLGSYNINNQKDSVLRYEFLGKVMYSKVNQILGNQIFDFSGKLDYSFSKNVSGFILSTYNKNIVRKIRDKINAGGGLNYIIFKDALETGFGFLGDFIYYTDHYEEYQRFSINIKNTNVINDKIKNRNEFLYQPNTRNKNYIMNFTSTMDIMLNNKLSFSNNFTLLYDNSKIVGLKKTDWNLITSLKYKLS